jgi:hypothetical protein
VTPKGDVQRERVKETSKKKKNTKGEKIFHSPYTFNTYTCIFIIECSFSVAVGTVQGIFIILVLLSIFSFIVTVSHFFVPLYISAK